MFFMLVVKDNDSKNIGYTPIVNFIGIIKLKLAISTDTLMQKNFYHYHGDLHEMEHLSFPQVFHPRAA